jgi:adenylate cyclase
MIGDAGRAKAAREIERKFLIKRLPADLKRYRNRQIEQGYLAARPDGTQLRLRKAEKKHSLTFKRGRGTIREEWEIALTPVQFNRLWPATAGYRLRKRRYDIPFGEFVIEVDVYGGIHQGLIVAEVEFKSPRQCRNFRPPDWLGRDISGQARYSNVKLARE